MGRGWWLGLLLLAGAACGRGGSGHGLTLLEFGRLDELMSAARVTNKTTCTVADKSELLLTVTTAAGERKYIDEDYGCRAAAKGAQPASGLGNVSAELFRLAR